MNKKITALFKLILTTSLSGYFCIATASADLISLFPLDKYDQKISDWVPPTSLNYTKPLLTPAQQAMHKEELYRHFFGKESPWNAEYINLLLSQPEPSSIKSIEAAVINSYSNQQKAGNDIDKIGYGANFRPYTEDWLAQIRNNIPLQKLSQRFELTKRAIAITNIQARMLPTEDPYFYSYKLAGEGYPFDNMQAAVVWAGTPLYILTESVDRRWSMVLTPSFIGWVKSLDIATVNSQFVTVWSGVAKRNLAGLIGVEIPIIDNKYNIARFAGYTGMLFPAYNYPNGIEILIPVPDEKQQARIHHANLSTEQAVLVPLSATPEHFSSVMQHLLGRPYGWGGMYFYNDCSAELKNFFAPFGIWLPTHSTNQVDPTKVLGTLDDISSSQPDPNVRSQYLHTHGHSWLTIVYIGHHVFNYLGEYADPLDPQHPNVLLSYQDMWGLRPKEGPDQRVVIGQSVLFPLLETYPEDTTLSSLLSKPTFQLFYLDQFPEKWSAARRVVIDMHALLSP